MMLSQKEMAIKSRYFIGWSLGLLAKLTYKTLDFELVVAQEHFDNPDQQVLYGLWHNRIAISTTSYQAFRKKVAKKSHLHVLTSASKDGEFIAGLMAMNGVESIRGSSHKNSKSAGLIIYKLLKQGKDICITPDGPKGPVYEPKSGLIQIAAKTQVPILPIKVEYADYWELSTWDKFRIPKPFSKVKVTYGELQWIPAQYDEAKESKKLITSLG